MAMTSHVLNKGDQMVRYYEYYSNVSQGKRKKPKEFIEESLKQIICGVKWFLNLANHNDHFGDPSISINTPSMFSAGI
jgi:hypothetical protein